MRECDELCGNDPFGYCSECNDPIEHHHDRYYDGNNNLVCSEDCKEESNFDLSRDKASN